MVSFISCTATFMLHVFIVLLRENYVNREDFVKPTTDERDKRDEEKILSLSSLLSVVKDFGCGTLRRAALGYNSHLQDKSCGTVLPLHCVARVTILRLLLVGLLLTGCAHHGAEDEILPRGFANHLIRAV